MQNVNTLFEALSCHGVTTTYQTKWRHKKQKTVHVVPKGSLRLLFIKGCSLCVYVTLRNTQLTFLNPSY